MLCLQSYLWGMLSKYVPGIIYTFRRYDPYFIVRTRQRYPLCSTGCIVPAARYSACEYRLV